MEVRRAHLSDAAQIAMVQVRAWQVGYRDHLPDHVLSTIDLDERVAAWESRLRDAGQVRSGTLIIGETMHDRVQGFARFAPSRDSDHDAQIVGEVAAFYIDPSAWRRGAGRQLMGTTLRELAIAGYSTATLWVISTNRPAIGFYEAEGWRGEGARQERTLAGAPISEIRFNRPLCLE